MWVWVGFLLGFPLGSLGYVGCLTLKDCRMCPFAFASDFGRYFGTSCSVSLVHVERKLFLIAVVIVDVHGLQQARWRKVIRSAFDFASYTLPAKWCSGILHSVISSFFLVVRGTIYRVDFFVVCSVHDVLVGPVVNDVDFFVVKNC